MLVWSLAEWEEGARNRGAHQVADTVAMEAAIWKKNNSDKKSEKLFWRKKSGWAQVAEQVAREPAFWLWAKKFNSNFQISFSLNQVTGTIWFNYNHANTCVSKYLKFKLSGSTPAGISELKKLKGGQKLTRVLTASVNLKNHCHHQDMNNHYDHACNTWNHLVLYAFRKYKICQTFCDMTQSRLMS